LTQRNSTFELFQFPLVGMKNPHASKGPLNRLHPSASHPIFQPLHGDLQLPCQGVRRPLWRFGGRSAFSPGSQPQTWEQVADYFGGESRTLFRRAETFQVELLGNPGQRPAPSANASRSGCLASMSACRRRWASFRSAAGRVRSMAITMHTVLTPLLSTRDRK
jgi:hypothetical protein